MTWPTKSKRPIRRATFGHAATIDHYVKFIRLNMRARELAETDWLLHRRNCNPFRRQTPVHRAYEKAFAAMRRATPNPPFPPIPDLPRARARNSTIGNEIKSNLD